MLRLKNFIHFCFSYLVKRLTFSWWLLERIFGNEIDLPPIPLREFRNREWINRIYFGTDFHIYAESLGLVQFACSHRDIQY